MADADTHHLDEAALDAGLDHIRSAPTDGGELQLIVRRPAENEREVLDEAELDQESGLVGDTWKLRGSRRTEDGSSHPDMQLNIMNSRVAELIAQDPGRWALAGDQLYIDLDISEDNLPAWTELAIGSAVIQVTDQPHTGCAKFQERFGAEARRWANTDAGKKLRLRGMNARVVQPGTIRRGDEVRKL